MNERMSPVQVRRSRPYLGLDYFTESDAALFFERDRDSRECADILMGFGVKILILQGSSGAGKSSFLRAGLVPYLKSKEEWHAHFLNDSDDDVIRCTSDPMKWIADAVSRACDQLGAMQMAESGSIPPGDTPGPCAALRDDALFRGPRKLLAEVVLDTLEHLCNELPGQLLLILDQAEEVHTQRDSDLNNDTTAALFYFLSEVYIRNIDVRIVVALRTEYYGRFRDELDIRDDRLGSRPRQGGVSPYLLKPIRDRGALIRIATAPARGEAAGLYNYRFDPNVAGRIVDDILKQERHGSVTPLLQAVCAVLYEDLGEDRNIRLKRYEELGGLPGITDRYVRTGFRSVLGRVETEVLVRWYHLLFSLVSRQGGGTLVSEIESLEELRSRADDLQISADVEGVLNALCTSSWPLLRGQPPERPTQFSLKHDVLAGFFFRWKVGEDARRAQQKTDDEALRKVEQANAATRNRFVFKTLVLATCVLLAVVGLNIYRNFEAQVGDRLALAAAPPRSDYGLSLLSLLTSLDATRTYGLLPFGLPTRGLHQQSIDALRQTLIRSPWLDGKYVAVGMSPEHDRALLLRENGTIVQLALSPQNAAAASAAASLMFLPPGAAKPRPNANVAAGFLAGLGPAVVLEGTLYYWRGGNPVVLQDKWPPGLRNMRPLRYEFVGGALQVTGPRQGTDGERGTYRYKITAADILGNRVATVKEEWVAQIAQVAPQPVFGESADVPDTVAYITRAAAANGSGTAEVRNPAAPGSYSLNVGRVGAGTWLDLPLLAAPAGYQDYLPFSPAFVVNDTAVMVLSTTGDTYWSPLATDARPGRGHGFGTISVAALSRDREALAPAQTYSPWIYSPLAAVQLPAALRFAWLADEGIWVADAKPALNRTVKAAPAPGIPAPLLVGEPGGSKLRFSKTGDFLMLQQQPYYGDTIQIRMWNLSSEWRRLIGNASEAQLVEMACAALKGSSREWKNAKAIGLFKLPGASLEPCRNEVKHGRHP